MTQGEIELDAALSTLSRPDLLLGCREIAAGDGAALRPEEAAPLGRAVPKVRAQSGAARIVARALMERFGEAPATIPRTPGKPPRWPGGLTGSMAHDPEFAVAVMARAGRWRGVGIDLEPALPLPPEILETVATPAEIASLDLDGIGGRLLFVIKEAVYKAVNPIDGIALDFQDVEVDLQAGCCRTASGWHLPVRWITAPRLCALVSVPRD